MDRIFTVLTLKPKYAQAYGDNLPSNYHSKSLWYVQPNVYRLLVIKQIKKSTIMITWTNNKNDNGNNNDKNNIT